MISLTCWIGRHLLVAEGRLSEESQRHVMLQAARWRILPKDMDKDQNPRLAVGHFDIGISNLQVVSFFIFFFVHFCSFFEAVSFHRRGRSLFDDGAPGGPSFFHPCWLGSWFGPSWGRNPSLLRFGLRLCGGEMMGLGDTR